MKKLKYYGFKEAKVQTRSLTLAELKLKVIEAYVERGEKEVQLIDITSGDTVTFNTIADVFENKWADNCKIELINLPHGYGTPDNTKTVILFQEAEEENDKVIA